jgi:Flp pilus assembly protein TadG
MKSQCSQPWRCRATGHRNGALPTRATRRQVGIATVEFTLVASVLVVLLFGVVQFGWLLNNYAKIANSTASAARFFASRAGSPTASADTWDNFYRSMGGMNNVITRGNGTNGNGSLTLVTAVAGVACTDGGSPTCGEALTTASKVVIASGGSNWADQRATVAVTWNIAGDPKRDIFGQSANWVGLGNLVPAQRVFTASERVIVAQ